MAMRSSFAAGAVVALATAADPDFERWAREHGKLYDTEEERERRYQIWLTNKEFVNSHNDAASNGVHTFTTALNHLADLSREEYLSMLSYQPSGRPKVGAPSEKRSLEGAPESLDWREAGIIPPIKDQARCGSCWAFSATVAMEAAFNQKASGSVPSTCTTTCGPNSTPCCSFSEQELVDCVNGGRSTCQTGGQMSAGVDEIVNQMRGVFDTEGEYPYTSGTGISEGICRAKADGVPTGLVGYTSVASGDEGDLQAKVLERVAAVAIDASHQSFQFYSDGVYSEPACSSMALDHGVAVVGYGVESGREYWTVRNSWGTGWGMDGYVRMSRNKDNQCGIASDALIANAGAAETVVV